MPKERWVEIIVTTKLGLAGFTSETDEQIRATFDQWGENCAKQLGMQRVQIDVDLNEKVPPKDAQEMKKRVEEFGFGV